MKTILRPHLVNYSMTFSPCNNYIAVSNNFNSINVLNLNDEKERRLLVCSNNNTANVYNLKTWGNILICTSDCYIIAWNWNDIIEHVKGFCSELNNLWKLTLPVNSEFSGCLQIISLFIDETNKIVYAGCSDGFIHQWQIGDDGLAIYLKCSQTNNGSVLCLTNGKGFELISGHSDGTVKFWDDRQDKEAMIIATQSCHQVQRTKLGKCVNVVATDSECSDWILCGGQVRLALWNVRAGRVGVVMETEDANINESWVAFSAVIRGDLVMAGGNSSRLFLWDLLGQLNSQISLGAINNVYGLVHQSNEFYLCGWGPAVELYSDIGYKKKIFTL